MRISGIQSFFAGGLILLGGIFAFFGVAGRGNFTEPEMTAGLFASLYWAIGLAICTLRGINHATSSLYFAFCGVLGLFHLGIPLGSLLGAFDENFANYVERWYYRPETFDALMAVILFLVGYFGAMIVRPRVNTTYRGLSGIFSVSTMHARPVFLVFAMLVFVWIVLVRFVHGVSNYAMYHQMAEIPILKFVYVYVTNLIGSLFVIICLSAKYRVRALVLFIFWAAFSFPIGLRGEVLFPLAIAVPLLVRQGVLRVNAFKATTGVLGILVLISVVYHYRAAGEIAEDANISPAAAIVEMGGSLRPVHEVFKWLGTGELDYFLGATYWAPFERAIAKIAPIIEEPEATDDDRLMNVVIFKKAGPYGFSLVAEAFINFGWAGVTLIGLACGYFFLLMDEKFRHAATTQYSIVDVLVVYALFFHVRQSFVGAFGSFAVSFILCAGFVVLRTMVRRRTLVASTS